MGVMSGLKQRYDTRPTVTTEVKEFDPIREMPAVPIHYKPDVAPVMRVRHEGEGDMDYLMRCYREDSRFIFI